MCLYCSLCTMRHAILLSRNGIRFFSIKNLHTSLYVFHSAKELLRNRGICSKAWNEWDESSRALPKIGAKQFEPNGSWLQNKQIEKGLESRRFLIAIERVERSSQLASAEWLPEQKKARVTKKSGHEWNNFGLEVNANLYLIAEEALILLETVRCKDTLRCVIM